MTLVGQQVEYKTGRGGRGTGIGTVVCADGEKMRIRTVSGKVITRTSASVRVKPKPRYIDLTAQVTCF